MSAPPPDFLVEWAGRPGPLRVLAAARDRLENGRLGVRSVVDVALSPAERQDVGRMMPAGWTASGGPVGTKALRAGLAEHRVSLEDLLTATGGPLRDLRGDARGRREAATRERTDAVAALRALLAVPVPPALEPAVADVLGRLVVRGPQAGLLVRDVRRAISSLPADGDVGLAVLAAHLFQDAHALDRSRTLGRAVARVLALRSALAASAGDPDAAELLAWSDPLGSAEAWRAAWASGGVTCDAVSSQVLVLNVPLVGDAPAVAWCRATPGEPTWLTLRSLSGGFALDAPRDVFVCENPSVVEAAASRLGAACPPLVCTFGRPTSAAWALLRGLGDARLHVRADGDAAGWSIVSALLTALPDADVWRMPEGSAEFEEELLQDLLADLARGTVDRASASGTRLGSD